MTNYADGSSPPDLVDQVECLAVVLCLGWAGHFCLCPLPLLVTIPFLLQHPPPRLEYHGAVEIRQRSDKSVVGPHGKTKLSPCMLPTDGTIRFLLHQLFAIDVGAGTVCLRRSDHVDVPHVAANHRHDVAYVGTVHGGTVAVVLEAVKHQRQQVHPLLGGDGVVVRFVQIFVRRPLLCRIREHALCMTRGHHA